MARSLGLENHQPKSRLPQVHSEPRRPPLVAKQISRLLPKADNAREHLIRFDFAADSSGQVRECHRFRSAILLLNQRCNPDNVCPLNRNPLQCEGPRTTVFWYRRAQGPWTREAYSSAYRLF